MAETEERSLDDFFAKRDKKKRKEKSSRGSATAASSSAASSNATAAGVIGGSRQAEGAHGTVSNANAATGGAKAANKVRRPRPIRENWELCLELARN